jgi:hypothetical protein
VPRGDLSLVKVVRWLRRNRRDAFKGAIFDVVLPLIAFVV